MVFLESPVRARLKGYENQEAALRDSLSYKDKRAEFEYLSTRRTIKRFKRQRSFFEGRDGTEAYLARLEAMERHQAEVKATITKTVLGKDEGGLWIPSGLAHTIGVDDEITLGYSVPEFDELPWAKKPKYTDRPYQVDATNLMLEAAGHGPVGIELATGAGKSTIIRNITKRIGLGTVVMAPSRSIAKQLFIDLTYHFGPRLVGMYGDGKKQYDKHIVVGIDDSLTRVVPGSDAWIALSAKPVFIADESHLCPAETLAKVCYGLMGGSPLRFFVSATQMRGDGLTIVLEGITGRIVMRMNVQELVGLGFLSRPHFGMFSVKSNRSYSSDDAVRMTREHLYYNPIVNKTAADTANRFIEQKRPVIILVEEVEQFGKLLPHFKHLAKFAHGPLTKDNRDSVPTAFQKDKPDDLVAEFNAGKLPILVGTSCIATGTDIQVAEAGIYLMGGKSEIKIKQAVGRETRGGFNGSVTNPWTGKQKTDCVHIDFRVDNIEALARHADERVEVYNDIFPTCSRVDMTHIK